MNFKNRTEYLELRNTLLANAETLVNDGKIEDANAKMEEVKELDSSYDDFAKAQANLNALNNSNGRVKGLTNTMHVAGKVVEALGNTTTEDIYDSTEYRRAFMNHVLRGDAIPAEFKNASQVTKTTDVGEVIPTTVMQKIIEKLESTGMILPLVTRTAYKGGVSIPTSSVKPTATWVAEGAGSDKQKKSTGEITFTNYKLRCAVAVSLETDTMALAVFESTLISNVAEAMVKALESAIVSGDGTGKPKGILAETPENGQALEIAEGAKLTYETLCGMEAALPLAYENGAVYLMTKKTFMAFASMVDTNGQPIARTTYGISGKPERYLLGRQVILNDYMDSYSASMGADAKIAALFNMKDYVLNTNLNMTMKHYEDNETDDLVTKAVMLVDGKVVDKGSLVTLTVKNAA